MLTPCININRLTTLDAWSSLRAFCYREGRKMWTKIDEIEKMEDLFEIMRSFRLNRRGYKRVEEMKTRLR